MLDKEYYQRIKKLNILHYSGETSYYTRAPLRKVEHTLLDKLDSKKSILDLGCGSGRFSIGAAQKGFVVTGLDITPDAIEAARNKAQKLKINNVSFSVGDMTSLPFHDNSFDYVFCPRFSINAVATQEMRDAALREMYRVVKPGGKIFIESFNKYYLGKGLSMPMKNICNDILRKVKIFIAKITGKVYSGLLPGDIIYQANKVASASVGYAHLSNVFELHNYVKRYHHTKKSITEIVTGRSFDPLKYLRYSIWLIVDKPI